jgi:tryptophan-rich sensory protein
MPRSPLRDGLILLGWLIACFSVAALGGWWTAQSVRDWYPTLIKPSWNPPSWVFGPVWTVLYAMMAVAAWLVSRQSGEVSVRGPILLFTAQLGLNLAWSAIFFGWQRPGAAFAEILALWLTIAATVLAFRRVHRAAAALLLPYWLWVSFAAALNGTIWRLNA